MILVGNQKNIEAVENLINSILNKKKCPLCDAPQKTNAICFKCYLEIKREELELSLECPR